MSDDTGAAPAGVTEQKKSGNTKLFIIIGGMVTLLAGAAGFLFLTPMGKHLLGKQEAGHNVTAPKDLVFYPIPELLVNLRTTQPVKKAPFLKLSLKLELSSPDDAKIMDLVKPKVIDQFQISLREIRVEDLQGSAGMQRLREELLKRANSVSAPAKVKDVLFEVMLIQ